MIVRNFLEAPLRIASSHQGKGEVKSVKLFGEEDYDSKLRFFYYMELPLARLSAITGTSRMRKCTWFWRARDE